MEKQSKVDFEEVMSIFLQQNAETPERNDWPVRALEIANNQFRTWTRGILHPRELGEIMLPRHNHGSNLVPNVGASVSQTLKRLDAVDRSSECYKRIEQMWDPGDSAIFLSVAPILPTINDSHYMDYIGLVRRGHLGLTHLDGLHRLIAWAIEDKRSVLAYIAGL